MKAYHLVEIDKDGTEKWLGTFESPDMLLDVLTVKPTLMINTTGGIQVNLGVDLSKYRVKTFEMNTITGPIEIDLPTVSITVPSKTDPTVTYGVTIMDGKLTACSCPDFIFHRTADGTRCKHMQEVYDWPTSFGLHQADWRGGEYLLELRPERGGMIKNFPSKLY